MKISHSLFLAAGVLAFILLQSFGGDVNSDYGGGSPGGYSGSPHDGANCTQCHNGTATNVANWITSTVPVAGYLPGTTYTVAVTITGTGKKGFECSPQALDGTLLGTLASGTGNHLVPSGKAVTQNGSVTTNPYTWSFSWTAPAAGTGPVTFYGAFAIGTGTTKLSTLVIPESTAGMEDINLFSVKVYPNPATSHINLTYFLNQSKEVRCCLLDRSGKEVMNFFAETQSSGNHVKQLDFLHEIPAGVYFLKLSSVAETRLEKVIIL